ncbi:hypothetical protein CRU96_05810 [Malaciobacter halophilus]|nr:ParB/RepB/Spo0J family partition protein [Malaciobacter halophilus]RYA23923.1 hypothetical protein CRU96_05810 [Malaciobacter halophilus]
MNLSAIEKVTKGRVKTSGVSDFSEIDISLVYPNPNQPRKVFLNIEELAETIKKFGLLQPIIVVKRNGKYMIVGGERRYKAHLLLNLLTIKAFIVDLTDDEIEEVTLIENIQRDNLTDFEKAKHIGQLWASGRYKNKIALAKRIGKGQTYISKAFSSLKLPSEIVEDIEENKNNIPISVLDEISRVKDTDIQKEVYEKYLAGEITRDDIKDFKIDKNEVGILPEIITYEEPEPQEIKLEFQISHGKENSERYEDGVFEPIEEAKEKKYKNWWRFSVDRWIKDGFKTMGWEDVYKQLDENKTYKITIEEI